MIKLIMLMCLFSNVEWKVGNVFKDQESLNSLKFALDDFTEETGHFINSYDVMGDKFLRFLNVTSIASSVISTYRITHEAAHRPAKYFDQSLILSKRGLHKHEIDISLGTNEQLDIVVGGLNNTEELVDESYRRSIYNPNLSYSINYMLGRQDWLLQWIYSFYLAKNSPWSELPSGDNSAYLYLMGKGDKEKDFWISIIPELSSIYLYQSIYNIGTYINSNYITRPWSIKIGKIRIYYPHVSTYRLRKGYFWDLSIYVNNFSLHIGRDLDFIVGDVNRIRLGIRAYNLILMGVAFSPFVYVTSQEGIFTGLRIDTTYVFTEIKYQNKDVIEQQKGVKKWVFHLGVKYKF